MGISIDDPNAASVIDIGHSKNKFSSDLLNRSCEFTLMKRYKSPLPAPLEPASPFPASLILVPSSTPLGIVTDSLLLACFFPCPLHEEHGFLISSQEPEH